MGILIISLGVDSLPALGGGSRQEVGWGRQTTGERVSWRKGMTERVEERDKRVTKILCYNNSNSYCLGSLPCARYCAKRFSWIIFSTLHKTHIK